MAETVVYTVSSRTSVRSDGIEPIGAYAMYEQSSSSGRVGQMTEGNYTSLQLYGFGGVRIRSISLMMHSNASSGGGTLEMNVGDSTVWVIEPALFSEADWYGDYSTSFVPIVHRFSSSLVVGKEQTIAIHIDALVSSLYVQSYTIEYDILPEEPCSVCFSSEASSSLQLREDEAGLGVVLPLCDDVDSVWSFIGWTEQPLRETTEELPSYYEAGVRYYPTKDTTLYALYSDCSQWGTRQIVQDTMCLSGDYVIVDKLYKAMAAGGVNSNKRLSTYRLDCLQKTEDSLYSISLTDIPTSAIYHIEFLDDSKATIYNVYDEMYVSYSGSSAATLIKTRKEWNYRKAKEGMIVFYHQYSAATYRELRADRGSSLETVDSLWFENSVSHSDDYASILFPVSIDDIEPPLCHYTTRPLGTALEQNRYSEDIYLKGKTLCNPQQLSLYLFSIQGELLATSTGDISLQQLPYGVYIVKTINRVYKFIIQ